jgi:hypothetical protein
MGRKVRNKHVEAILMFWLNLSEGDRAECLLDMMRCELLVLKHEPKPKDAVTKTKRKGEPKEEIPLQTHVVG